MPTILRTHCPSDTWLRALHIEAHLVTQNSHEKLTRFPIKTEWSRSDQLLTAGEVSTSDLHSKGQRQELCARWWGSVVLCRRGVCMSVGACVCGCMHMCVHGWSWHWVACFVSLKHDFSVNTNSLSLTQGSTSPCLPGVGIIRHRPLVPRFEIK